MKKKLLESKIHCNRCQGVTLHSKVATYSYTDSEFLDENFSVDYTERCFVWECKGCRELVCEFTNMFSENTNPDGSMVVNTSYYPGREINVIKVKEYENIPGNINVLYKEIIDSYNNSCIVLCSMGLRALVEAILVQKEIKGKDLQQKINSAEFIPENIRKNMHGFRFLGNDAAHRLEKPEKEDILIAINVVEDVMNIVFELDNKSTLIFQRFSKGRSI